MIKSTPFIIFVEMDKEIDSRIVSEKASYENYTAQIDQEIKEMKNEAKLWMQNLLHQMP